MKRIIYAACLFTFHLVLGENASKAMPLIDRVGSSAGVSVNIFPSTKEVGNLQIHLDSVVEHLIKAGNNPDPPLDSPVEIRGNDFVDNESRRKLSMSLQREAQIQDIFKKQELYLKRDVPTLPLDEPQHHINQAASAVPPKPPQKAEKPHSNTNGMVYIHADFNLEYDEPKGFFVSAKPVTNQEYFYFVFSTNYHSPIHWIGGKIPEGLESTPVVNVSYHDALTYAIWAGKRLPTKSERINAERTLKFYHIKNKRFNEWTSTSFHRNDVLSHPNETVILLQHPVKTQYKAIHSNSQGLSFMYKEDRNNHTGFRVALDAFQ